ncbi:MAG TPA: phytoene desaturase [Myxococcaceae bacterium]|nr:phytoene desaturase [Myxococcaceae bacterium]
MSDGGKRVAVVGSGFGGLAVAIRLQAMGLQTVLFEARDKPGGRAYVHEEQGFTFDAGPTVITAPHCLEELYTLTGRNLADHVELLPVQPFYRLLWDDGDRFDYDNDQASLLAQIERRSPADVQGYLRFAEYSRAVFTEGYERLVAEPFLRFSDMVKVAPKLMGLRADRSVYGAVSKFVKDEHLRQALSFHALLVGGNPMDTSAIYALIHHLEKKWGVFFPRGGTGALVRALASYFETLGGELRLSAPVERITLAPNGAGRPRHLVTSPGSVDEPFDLVVSNADLHHTYARLYGQHPKAQRRAKRLARMDWSMSLFVLYFGTDRTYDIAHHTVLFGPRYEGLLRDIFHGPTLPEDFSLYLHAPTVTDPSMAPPGCGSFYVLSPVPHLGKAAVDWSKEAAPYAEKVLTALERHLPDLRKHVVVKRWMTPQDFQSQLGAFQGSAFSCAPTLTQSAWFRAHNRDPDLPGLYLVGAGTHPGAGVPGVVNSAKATAKVIAADLGLDVPQQEVA